MEKKNLEIVIQQLLLDIAESGFVISSMVPQGEAIKSIDDIYIGKT